MSCLWMGDLDPYMDESFIKNSFMAIGLKVTSVKVIRNKITGESMGYCFVDFGNSEIAQHTMLKYNGKIVPNSKPVPRRFKLNYANYGKDGSNNGQGYSVFVGDLTEDVDDLLLYSTFTKRYPSCKLAKVVLNEEGISRGYGFVRFEDQTEQKRAMIEMQGHRGLGGKPIRVSPAQHKKALMMAKPGATPHEQAWIQQQEEQQTAFNNSMAEKYVQLWHQHYGTDPNYAKTISNKATGKLQDMTMNAGQYADPQYGYDYSQYPQPIYPIEEYEEDELVDPELDINVEQLNERYIKTHMSLQDMISSSRYLHFTDKNAKTLDPGQLKSIFSF